MPKILIGSDYHNTKSRINEALDLLSKPEVDAYIYLGDFCNMAGYLAFHHNGFYRDQGGQEEVNSLHKFLKAVDKLRKPWIFLPGNHEPAYEYIVGSFYKHGKVIRNTCQFSWLGLEVFALPYTPPCGFNWDLKISHIYKAAEIAEAPIDLFLSHSPVQGILDEGMYKERQLTALNLVQSIKPKYFLCGHAHNDGNKSMLVDGTVYYNTALYSRIIEV